MRPNRTKPTAKSSPKHVKSRQLLALGAVIAALALAIGANNTAQRTDLSAPDRYVPDEVLVRFASDAPEGVATALARRLRLDRLASFTSEGAVILRWRIPDRRAVPAVVRALEAEPFVLAAQPNYLYGSQELHLAGWMHPADIGQHPSGRVPPSALEQPKRRPRPPLTP